jgi:hypothetical protein
MPRVNAYFAGCVNSGLLYGIMTLDLARTDAGQPEQRKRTSCEWRRVSQTRSQAIPLKDTKDTDNEGDFVSFVALSGGEGEVTGLR